MPEVKPFKALRFNKEKVGDISNVISPPYDVISQDMREVLTEKSPYNTVNLILPDGEGEEKYQNARNTLMSWILRDVLIVEDKPSIYIWYQTFSYLGRQLTRKGFISVLKLEELGKGVIPHEKTLKGPKEDRLKLLKSTETNFGHIFMLYEDNEKRIISKMDEVISQQDTEPLCEVTDYEGTSHKLWKTSDPELLTVISSVLSETPVYIADGHHRYETSLAYSKEQQEKTNDPSAPFNYVMTTMFNFEDEGLVVLPTHRLVKAENLDASAFLNALLKNYKAGAIPFNEDIKKASVSKFIKLMRQAKTEGRHAIGVFIRSAPSKIYFLQLKTDPSNAVEGDLPDVWKKLDVVILQKLVLEKVLGLSENQIQEGAVQYVRGEMNAIEEILKGKADIAFLVNPIDVKEMKMVADTGASMPQKSTDFYPKLPSGFTFFNFRYGF